MNIHNKKLAFILLLLISLPVTGFNSRSHPAIQQRSQNQAHPPSAAPCLPGRRLDPSYIPKMEETGNPIMILDPSEADQASVVEKALEDRKDTVLRVVGKLDGNSQELMVPVDSTIQSIVFSVFIECLKSITVVGSDGKEVVAGKEGIEDNIFRSGRVLVVKTPKTGAWRVIIAGTGAFSAIIQAQSAISFGPFDFAQISGPPGSEVLVPLNGPPQVAVKQAAIAYFTGTVASAKFKLVTSNGTLLKSIKLAKKDPNSEFSGYEGTIVPSYDAFRFVVEGKDSQGMDFQRCSASLFHPKTNKE